MVGAELTVGGAAGRDWGHTGDGRADLGDGFGFANGKADEEGDAAEREEENETVGFHNSPLDRNSADKHAAKLASLNDRILRARQKVEKEKAEAKSRSMQTYVSIGTAVFTALFGRKVASSATVGRAATSMRSASRAARQQADVAHAEESLSELEEKLAELEAKVAEELDEVRLRADPDSLVLEPIEVAPRKTDVSVEEVVLAWVPVEAGAGGRA